MKIKKKDLRKGEAQLPINYPDPEVAEEHAFCFEAEKTRVENLCKRLAHNEVVVRDAVLAELPRYIHEVTQRVAVLDKEADEAALCRFVSTRNKDRKKGGKVGLNLLRELDEYRKHEENARRDQRRQEILQQLRQEQQQHHVDDDDEDGGANHGEKKVEDAGKVHVGRKSLRQTYREWISVWGEVELLLLKLSRGIYFCLWHSDKPLVQLDCAQRIARLIYAPQTNSGKILLFSCLMRVLAREWRTMDRYRSDKFLALVRKLIYELVCLLKTVEHDTLKRQVGGGPAPDQVVSSLSHTSVIKGENDRNGRNRSVTHVKKAKKYHEDDVTSHEPLSRALEEACYVFQEQTVPAPSAVGLCMHMCDVLFDELCRAEVSPALFVALGDRIALYAMSQGNYVEKRVLDYFISPIAGGVLATRRRQQQQQQADDQLDLELVVKKKRPRNESGEDDGGVAADEKAAEEARAIILALADCCRRYSVSRRTVRSVCAMLTEAEMVLRQAADPASFVELTRRAMRRRIEHEIDEVKETRHAVMEERSKVRLLRQQERRKKLVKLKKKLKKAHKTDVDAGKSKSVKDGGENDGTHQLKRRTAKPLPRNTKRKKHYTLTAEDLYGDE